MVNMEKYGEYMLWYNTVLSSIVYGSTLPVFPDTVIQAFSVKIVYLKISPNSRDITCAGFRIFQTNVTKTIMPLSNGRYQSYINFQWLFDNKYYTIDNKNK